MPASCAKPGLTRDPGPCIASDMKELRFDAADGAWRVAFAFDTARQAVVLVAGDKSGGSETRFYRNLIATADNRFDDHLARQKKGD